MTGLTLETLPYDVFVHILHFIDYKRDLENLGLALPNSAGKIIPPLIEKLYWREIRYFLLPTVLLYFRFHNSLEAVELLEKLHPLVEAARDRRYYRGLSIRQWKDEPPRDEEKDARALEEVEEKAHKTSVEFIKSLSPEVASKLKHIYLQIERLADKFVDHQIKSRHQFSGESFSQPTPEEWGWIMKAIYNAWSLGITNLLDVRRDEALLVDLDQKTLKPVPDVDRKMHVKLMNEWTTFDFKETGVVLGVLWEEIPKSILQEVKGENWTGTMNDIWVWKDNDGPSNNNYKLYIKTPTDLIDFIFTAWPWNAKKHADFLDCSGNPEKGRELLNRILFSSTDARILFGFPRPAYRDPATTISLRSSFLEKCKGALQRSFRGHMHQEPDFSGNRKYCRWFENSGWVEVSSENLWWPAEPVVMAVS